MAIIAENFNDSNTAKFLNIKDLVEGSTYTKVAYVTYTRGKVSNPMPDGYFTLGLKDCNGQSVFGVILNAESYDQAGASLRNLTNKPVNLTFTTEIYNGHYSLLISSVSEYTEDDFPFKSFVGEVKEAPKFLAVLNKMMETASNDLRFSPNLATLTFDDMLGGRVGGFCQIIHSTAQQLTGNIGLPNYDHSTAMILLCLVTENYHTYRFLKEAEMGKLPSITTSVSFIANATNSLQEFNIPYIKEYFADTLSVFLGIKEKPSTMYGYYIYTAYTKAITSANFAVQMQALATGYSLNFDGMELNKYE